MESDFLLCAISHTFIDSKKLYKIAEQIRYEKLGSDRFKGVKNNIQKYYQERINSLDLKSSEDKIVVSFESYLRNKFFDSKNSKELEKKLKIFKKDLDDKFKGKIKELNNLTQNQAQYNALISTLISEMGLDDNFNEEDKKDDDNKDKKPDDTKNEEQQADKKEEINQFEPKVI